MDTVKQGLMWIGIGALTSPVWGALLWMLWEGRVRPRLIPRAEIESLALAMIARHGAKAAEMDFIEEDRAWRHSSPFEQGQWRRVRMGIERLSAKKEDCAGRHSPRN